MQENINFIEYKKLKNQLNSLNILEFKNLKMGTILGMKLYHLKSKNKNFKELIFKILLVLFFDSYRIEKIKQNKTSNILFMYSVSDNKRKDLKLLYDNLYSLYLEEDNIHFYNKRKLKLKLNNILKIKLFLSEMKIIENFYDRLMISVMLIQMLEIKNKIQSIEIDRYKLLITFCDIFEQDNFLVQEFKNNNKITVSMQHGQAYCKKGKETSDDLEYENFTSDFKLAWGQQTKDQMIKGGVEAKKIHIVGNPKYMNSERRKVWSKRKKNIGVVLNNTLNININKQMIKEANMLCKAFGVKYNIKLHPTDDISNYKDIIENQYLNKVFKVEKLEVFLKTVFYSLVNYSSIYMEMLYYYHPTFLYINKLTELIYEDDFNTYRNYEELLNKIMFMEKNEEEFDKRIEKKSSYLLERNVEENMKKFMNFLRIK